MIGFLSGKIISKRLDNIILLINGVGYQVFVPQNILSGIDLSSDQSLYIYTQVREEALDLYGFKSEKELEFFKLLISVSGVGAKTGLLIMNQSVESIQNAIIQADVEFFSRIPRLGKKSAQKIIIDLKNKVGNLQELDLLGQSADSLQVIDALVGMGYSRKEAGNAVKSVPKGVDKVEEMIRVSLRSLAKS